MMKEMTIREDRSAGCSNSLYPSLGSPESLVVTNTKFDLQQSDNKNLNVSSVIRDSRSSVVYGSSTPPRSHLVGRSFSPDSSVSSDSAMNVSYTPCHSITPIPGERKDREYITSSSTTRMQNRQQQPTSILRGSQDIGSARRSILRCSRPAAMSARGNRPSVSFAKQKEIMTFRATEERSSIESNNNDTTYTLGTSQHEIQHVMLSPVSERLAESSRGSTISSKSQNIHDGSNDLSLNDLNSTCPDDLFLSKATATIKRLSEGDTSDIHIDSPYGSDASSSWMFPSIEDIAKNSSHTPSKKYRSSLLSAINSPAPVYRFNYRISALSDPLQSDTPCHITTPISSTPFITNSVNLNDPTVFNSSSFHEHTTSNKKETYPVSNSLEKESQLSNVSVLNKTTLSDTEPILQNNIDISLFRQPRSDASTLQFIPAAALSSFQQNILSDIPETMNSMTTTVAYDTNQLSLTTPSSMTSNSLLNNDIDSSNSTNIKRLSLNQSSFQAIKQQTVQSPIISTIEHSVLSDPLLNMNDVEKQINLKQTGQRLSTPFKSFSLFSSISHTDNNDLLKNPTLQSITSNIQQTLDPLSSQHILQSSTLTHDTLQSTIPSVKTLDTDIYQTPRDLEEEIHHLPVPLSQSHVGCPQTTTIKTTTSQLMPLDSTLTQSFIIPKKTPTPVPRISLSHIQNPLLSSADRHPIYCIPSDNDSDSSTSSDVDHEYPINQSNDTLSCHPDHLNTNASIENSQHLSSVHNSMLQDEHQQQFYDTLEPIDNLQHQSVSSFMKPLTTIPPLQSFSTVSQLKTTSLIKGQHHSRVPSHHSIHDPSFILYTPRTASELFTPRTASRRTIGPIKVSQGGVWERLENGGDLVTPRPTDFNVTEVKLNSTVSFQSENQESINDNIQESIQPISQQSILQDTLHVNAYPLSHQLNNDVSYRSLRQPLDTLHEVEEDSQDITSPCIINYSHKSHDINPYSVEIVSTDLIMDTNKLRRLSSFSSSHSTKPYSARSRTSERLPPITLDHVETPNHFLLDEEEEEEEEEEQNDPISRSSVSFSQQQNHHQGKQSLTILKTNELTTPIIESPIESLLPLQPNAIVQYPVRHQLSPAPAATATAATATATAATATATAATATAATAATATTATATAAIAAIATAAGAVAEVHTKRSLFSSSSSSPFYGITDLTPSNGVSSPQFGYQDRFSVSHSIVKNSQIITQDESTQHEPNDVFNKQTVRSSKRHSDRMTIQEENHSYHLSDIKDNSSSVASTDHVLQHTQLTTTFNDVLNIYKKFGLNTEHIIEQQDEILQRVSCGIPLTPFNETTLFTWNAMRQSILPDSRLSPFSNEPRMESLNSSTNEILKQHDINPLVSVQQDTSLNDQSSLQRHLLTPKQTNSIQTVLLCDKESELSSESNVFPSIGLEWNDFHVSQNPYLNHTNFLPPYPSLNDLQLKAIETSCHTLKQDDPLNKQEFSEVFTPNTVAILIDWIEHYRLYQISDNTHILTDLLKNGSVEIIELLKHTHKQHSSILDNNLFQNGIDHLISIFKLRATIESWNELLPLLEDTWKDRYQRVTTLIETFPTTLISREQLYLTTHLKTGSTAIKEQAYLAFMHHLQERSELLCVLALAQWKIDISLPTQLGSIDRLQATAIDIHRAVKQAEYVLAHIQQENEEIHHLPNDYPMQNELRHVRHQVISELEESTLFERKQKDRLIHRLQDKTDYCLTLETAVQKTQEEVTYVLKSLQQHSTQLKNYEAAIRLSTLQNDFLEFQQRALGIRLTKTDLDCIEIECIPERYIDSLSKHLWEQYLSQWVPTKECLANKLVDSSCLKPDTFEAWRQSRHTLMEALNELEIEQDYTIAKDSKHVLLQGLAALPGPKISVLWRYEESLISNDTTDSNEFTTKQTMTLIEGLKIQLQSGISDNLLDYIPTHLKQYQLSHSNYLSESQRDTISQSTPPPVFERRFIVEKSQLQYNTITLGLGPVLFDWEVRRYLFQFVEKQLNMTLLQDIQPFGLPKTSPIEHLLFQFNNHSSVTTTTLPEIPFSLFAPVVGTDKILETMTIALLHCRRIESLMNQQRELLSRYHPTGVNGTDITYIKGGLPFIDYRLSSDTTVTPDISCSLASAGSLHNDDTVPIFKGDEIVFTVVLNHQHLNMLKKNKPPEITITIVCNVAISIIFGSFVYGIRRSCSGVFVESTPWSMNRKLQQEYKRYSQYLNVTFQESVSTLSHVSRHPLVEDLAEVIRHVENAWNF